MAFDPLQIQAIQQSKQSVTWFLRNFAKLKHPSAGILPFYPFSYQRKAIKAFRKNRLNIFRKCRQCFAGESMVWTPTGPKRIDSIKSGDKVYSFNADYGRLDAVVVEEVFDNGEMEVCEVTSKTGHRSISTLDHNYFTYDGEIEAQNLTSDDRLIEVNDWERIGITANKSEAIVLGYMIADGYYGHSNSGQGHFTNTCWRYLLEYQKHFYKLFGIRRPIKPHNRDENGKITSYRIYYSQKPFWDWVEKLGISGQIGELKKIPDIVFSWDNNSIAIFLNRLFAADGWYSGDHCNEVGIGQESIEMLHQIKQLLSRFGIDSRVYPATESSMNKLRIFGGRNFQIFVENIGIFNKTPRLPIAKGFSFNRKKGEVKKVVRNGRKERVYDLKVPPHHNYVVDGAVVHNSGISKISGAFATWFAMFHSHKTILIVSRTNDDAMGFLRENIVFLYENLPEWMVEAWRPIKQNEHEIIFPNGSKIKSLTSHPDVLRSNASSLNIIDEAAFIQGMDVMWAGGWPCARYNTLIQTSEGLIEVGDLAIGGNPWSFHDISVATDDGFRQSDRAYNSGLTPTKIITTGLGFELEGTYHHRIRSISPSGDYVWKRLDECQPEDIIVSMPGHYRGVKQTIVMKEGQTSTEHDLTPEFAELLGLYVGDGSLSTTRPKRFKIVFDYKDSDTRDRMVEQFNNLGLGLPMLAYREDEYDTANLRLNSAEFVQLMSDNNLISKTKPQDAKIPKKILQSEESVLCGFLGGLFDSDGWCYQSSTSLKLGLSSTSERLVEQVQVALHALGIISRRYMVDPSDTPDRNDLRYSEEPYWRLDIWDCRSKSLFKKKIKFLSKRKQDCLDAFQSETGYAEINHPVLVSEFVNAVLDRMSLSAFRDRKDPRKRNLYRIRRIGIIRIDLVRQLSNEFGLNDRLSEYVRRGFAFDTISSVRNGETETFDISVPDNNTYLANGIVNHNTLQHGGNVIVISTCVAPDTIINTANGLCEIQDLSPDSYDGFEDGYYHADYNGPDIVGINGLENATKFYKRPREATKIITTTCGYQLEASLRHKLPVVDGATGKIVKKYIHELQIGDYLPVKSGQMVFGNNDRIDYVDSDKRFNDQTVRTFEVDVIDENLAYMLGILTAEGHVREEEVVLSCGDSEVLDRCESWRDLGWKRGRKNQDYVTISRRPMFVRFLQFLGVELTTAPFKTIPKRLLKCSEPVIRSFLRGLFDGDGAALTRGGQVCYASTSKKLIKQVRMLLFNYGIHTYLETSPPGTTSFTRSDGTAATHDTLESYRLYVSSNFTNLFYDLIGFDLERKHVLQENKTAVWSELMPPVVKSLLKQLKDTTDLSIAKMTKLGLAPNVLYGTRSRITKNRLAAFMSKISYEGNDAYDSLIELLEYDWFNCITKLEESENEVYDFTLPSTHTFIGDCFININTNGLGNWYWATCTDAEAGANQFNPIVVNWWDMDWAIEYQDPLSLAWKRIAPRDGIRECTSLEDIERYGQYWSPWLEEQYRALQEQGEAWKFEQEILASFIGSGNTVLDKSVISYIGTTVKDPEPPEGIRVTGYQTYVHPVSGNVEDLNFNFREANEGLWIWKKPVLATPVKKKGNIIIDEGSQAHSYVMGVDIATGKGRDYSAIEVFDIDLMEQVAEFMARCLPRELIKYVDRIGRYYNNALAVVERNNGGDIVIDQLRYDLLYPRLWRQQDINDKPKPAGATSKPRPIQVKPYGWNTTSASKPVLNKFLIDYLRNTDGEGYTIYSKRLFKQLQTYVRKRDRSGRDTLKTEAEDGAGNFDDLVMACAMALRVAGDGHIIDTSNLIPVDANNDFASQSGPIIYSDSQRIAIQQAYADKGGSSLLMPMSLAPEESMDLSIQREIDTYAIQLGGIPISEGKPIVTPSKFYFERR